MTTHRWHLAFLLVAAVAVPSFADTVIVDESFDDYADDNALLLSWESSNFSDDAILTSDDGAYPGIQGQAVDHIGGSFNEWVESAFSIQPSDTESIVVGGDLYDDTGGNKRLTVGLRNSGSPNILELGFWNTEIIGWAYRIILWDGAGENPNWAFFELNPGFDRPDDADEVVNPADIQVWAADNGLDTWHRWEATITPTDVTLTFDLFRDGLENDPADNDNSTTGVDATITVGAIATDAGFDSLRIGGPSGVTSPQFTAIDNVLLMLKDDEVVIFDEADFNEDGAVDGDDFLLWQGGFERFNGDATKMDGDANADGFVDGNDFLIWQQQFDVGDGAGSGAVPEPNSVALAALVLLGLAGLRKRFA